MAAIIEQRDGLHRSLYTDAISCVAPVTTPRVPLTWYASFSTSNAAKGNVSWRAAQEVSSLLETCRPLRVAMRRHERLAPQFSATPVCLAAFHI